MLHLTAELSDNTCGVVDKCSVVAEMGDHLATVDMGQKRGTAVPRGKELGPHLIQCGMGQGLPPYEVAS